MSTDNTGEGLAAFIAQRYEYHPAALADAILASDWLATREREAEQRGAEKALRDAAEAIDSEPLLSKSGMERNRTLRLLRARADATRSR